MFTSGHFLIFFSAAFLLAISPGPGMLYVLARSLKGGKKVGLASSFGTALGGIVHVVAAALGLSAILAQSAYAFLFVKYLGAAYLVYLGIRALFSGDAAMIASVDKGKKAQNPFWQGVLTEVLNPKTALFFLAFIPQFVNHDAPLLPQFLLLGATSIALNTSADLIVVLTAAPLAKRLETSITWRRRQRQVSGAALVGLGSYVAAS
jgi:threonine/homoserine/homoserine lactone efflux protein